MAKTKQIEWSGAIDDRISFACMIAGINSEVEVDVVKALYKANNGSPTPFDTHMKNIECVKSGNNVNTFNVSLSRLINKGFVMKVGKMYRLHDLFVGLDETDSITIKWKK